MEFPSWTERQVGAIWRVHVKNANALKADKARRFAAAQARLVHTIDLRTQQMKDGREGVDAQNAAVEMENDLNALVTE